MGQLMTRRPLFLNMACSVFSPTTTFSADHHTRLDRKVDFQNREYKQRTEKHPGLWEQNRVHPIFASYLWDITLAPMQTTESTVRNNA